MFIYKIPFYFLNVFIHMSVYFLFCIVPLKKDYRFSQKTTLLLSFLFILIFCAKDVLFFESQSPLAKWKYYVPIFTTILCFAFTMIIVKQHYFQLLFIILVCFNFHVLMTELPTTFLRFFHVPAIFDWFPELNNLIGQLLTQLIALYPMWYLSKKLFSKVIDNRIDFLQWRFTIFLPTFLLAMSIFYEVYIMANLSNGFVAIITVIIMMLVSYFANLSILKILIVSDEKHLIEEKTQVAEKQIDIQKASFTQLNSYIAESARERHDFRHHFHVIKSLIDSGELAMAKDYFDEYDSIHIDDDVSYCDNKAINAIFKYYLSTAKATLATIHTDIIIPENIGIPAIDLCVVVGNIIENAVEALSKQSSAEKFLDIKAHVITRQFVLIVSNSYSGEILKKDNEIYSSKQINRVGIGIDSVKKLVAENGGNMQVDFSNNTFKVSILLNLE